MREGGFIGLLLARRCQLGKNCSGHSSTRCTATTVAPYWPGQFQQLEALAEEVIILPRVLLDMNIEKYELVSPTATEPSGWDAGLPERWRGEPGDSSLTELAVKMNGAALGSKPVGNYRPTAIRPSFCVEEDRQRPASCSPHLSAINSYHEDMGFPGPAKSRGLWRAVKGMIGIPAGANGGLSTCKYTMFAIVTFGRPDTGVSMLREHISIAGDTISVVLHKEKRKQHDCLEKRLTIPADGVQGLVHLLQHWEQVQDALWVQVSAAGSGELYSHWRLPWGQGKLQSTQANLPMAGCSWHRLSSVTQYYHDLAAVPTSTWSGTSGGLLRGDGGSSLALQQ
ncbi:hypothetical protein CYMTET_41066 [Cymbomonas tetramitiformis]|uniref:Uncharacterized protein n=1 Tax=Cymbomonas tetramitiformis TaxID=36881 RepID=A0AAE0C859_9CHLO|nr:hypothetical protein CYMTET_41066 [Cymbomonas tetramitiformis]